MSTLDSIARGVAASAVGTLAMDTWLYRGYRRGGGDVGFANWESSVGVASWEDAPAPAKVAKRLLEAVLRRDVPPRYARALNNATHWAFGLGAGAAYGLLLGSGHKSSKVVYGPPFGAGVWAGGYVVLPVLGVYEPIWDYDLKTLGKDLEAHLVFGTVTAAAYSLLPGEAGS
jgi:hypothetical protein